MGFHTFSNIIIGKEAKRPAPSGDNQKTASLSMMRIRGKRGICTFHKRHPIGETGFIPDTERGDK